MITGIAGLGNPLVEDDGPSQVWSQDILFAELQRPGQGCSVCGHWLCRDEETGRTGIVGKCRILRLLPREINSGDTVVRVSQRFRRCTQAARVGQSGLTNLPLSPKLPCTPRRSRSTNSKSVGCGSRCRASSRADIQTFATVTGDDNPTDGDLGDVATAEPANARGLFGPSVATGLAA